MWIHIRKRMGGHRMNVVIVDDTPLNLTLMQALVKQGRRLHRDQLRQPSRRPGMVPSERPGPADRRLHDAGDRRYRRFIRRLRADKFSEGLPILMVTADHEKQTR